MIARIAAWLGERLPLAALRELASHKTVPQHRASVWYYFGGMSLFLFFIQVVTGSLLLLYYRPSADHAWESVQFIMTKVSFGWLIRSIHKWSADLMILFLFLHMFSTFFLKAYRKPRELTWVSGCVLLGICFGLGFSGYLLPWNTLSFFATAIGTETPKVIPVAGEFIVKFLRGGEEVTGATLTRFFAWHVAILPALLVTVLGLHLAFIQAQGMSVPIAVKAKPRPLPFFPNFVAREALAWVLALALLASLAAFFPAELGTKADPFAAAPDGLKPEWYFLFAFQTLKLLPATVMGIEGEALGVFALSLAGLLWVLVPFLDRRSARGEKSPLFTALGVVALVFFVGMTIYGWKS
ncbi:MAG: cytochrome b N-terminal domain-containing protein [Planctomycetaceae bacterium]|nr:cytochrome b N-terminal domain-containing protein [Planctomycetota bacterium]NUN51351.1 cytochrome b N-terminal domain-containing protein [Planctomycetaceae bacterium]